MDRVFPKKVSAKNIFGELLVFQGLSRACNSDTILQYSIYCKATVNFIQTLRVSAFGLQINGLISI